jgi:NAD(P)-dependent dehydrogenase (short-subunit alcohol dehydrogenase family)
MQGNRIAVLGGSSGIGFAVAQRAARAGAEVIVVSRSKTRVDTAATQIGATGRTADLGDPREIAALFEELGELDHVVYTAGGPLALTPIRTLDLAAAHAFFEVRYYGALATARHARVRAGGSITLTGGSAGTRPHAGWAVAASLCGAMEALARALAVELAPVRVNIVVPGFVDTDLWSPMGTEAKAEMFRAAAAALPVQHVGTAEEIAGAYVAMMTNTYLTGQRLVVDGGAVLV